ncbi:MAG: glutathione S-transferase family protein [Devosia nanyangense]|uniref:Glutathione S-transferase family protein n=1 Tax=Devosia nanyangense TaxID=1228055 RepID=A0A933NYR3_9HYPH|nr:glutathione S-transferase family protein [Devosia nanyangense]
MYTLHIANKNYSSWSLRPWVLLKTLGIPFEEKLHRFPADRPSYPEFRHFSPTGLVPVLEDGDWRAWESLGIVEYLADRHPGIWPADQRARDWARSAAAEMHAGFSSLRSTCGMNCGIRVTLPAIPDAVGRDLARIEELWADGLDRFGGPFLAGKSFTAVDAFFCPVAFRVQTYGLPLGGLARAYVDRLLALPAMREWYAAALSEDFREPGHEADAGASGEWTADLRAKPKT